MNIQESLYRDINRPFKERIMEMGATIIPLVLSAILLAAAGNSESPKIDMAPDAPGHTRIENDHFVPINNVVWIRK